MRSKSQKGIENFNMFWELVNSVIVNIWAIQGVRYVEAVEEGKISPVRYDNYHRLIESLSETKSQRHFSVV